MSKALTVDEVRAIADAVPATYAKEQAVFNREVARVKDFQAQQSENALLGGDTGPVPEELEARYLSSMERLRQAKRKAFATVYAERLEADLRQEREQLAAVLAIVPIWQGKIETTRRLAEACGARVPDAVILDEQAFEVLRETLRHLTRNVQASRPAPPRRSPLSPRAILDRVLAKV